MDLCVFPVRKALVEIILIYQHIAKAKAGKRKQQTWRQP